MSYDIYLVDPVTKEQIETDMPHMMAGGTYAIGGTKELWLNVTYNYARWYYKDGVFAETEEESNGIRSIYGLSGAESVNVLQNAISVLQDMTEDISDEERKEYEEQGITGYWLPTRENAIKPLYQLLAMAQIRPDGIWRGD